MAHLDDNHTVVNFGPQTLLRGTNTRDLALTIKIVCIPVGKIICATDHAP